MPDASLDIQAGTDRSPVERYAPLDNGLLLSLSASIMRGSTTIGRTHILAGITTDTLPDGIFHTVLIDDYVYDARSPSWTGTFPLEASDLIVGIVRSADGVIVRLTGRTITAPFPIVHVDP